MYVHVSRQIDRQFLVEEPEDLVEVEEVAEQGLELLILILLRITISSSSSSIIIVNSQRVKEPPLESNHLQLDIVCKMVAEQGLEPLMFVCYVLCVLCVWLLCVVYEQMRLFWYIVEVEEVPSSDLNSLVADKWGQH